MYIFEGNNIDMIDRLNQNQTRAAFTSKNEFFRTPPGWNELNFRLVSHVFTKSKEVNFGKIFHKMPMKHCV